VHADVHWDMPPSFLVRAFSLVVILIAFCGPVLGQGGSLALSFGASQGSSVTLNLSLTSPAGGEPAGIQWTLTYAPSNVVSITASAGASATAASKSISCNAGTGSYACLIAGPNSTAIQNGVVAVVTVTLAPGVTGVAVEVTNTLGASPNGTALPISGAGVTVTLATVPITVTTSPSGLAFTVDGTSYAASQIFQWIPGTNHMIAVTTSPQSGGTGIQDLYASWSDGGAQSHSVTAPSSATTYTADFTTQFFLTTSAGSGGTISPASEWVNSGASVPIGATANSGYQFTGFTGAVTGTTNPASLMVNAPAAVTASFSSSSGGSNWYSASWSYQKAITINHAEVSGSSNLTDFPALISLAADPDLAAHAQSSGNDILFTDASGINKLNHEIETYNTTSGQLIAWVQVPSVSPVADTVIYMYYGNPSAVSQQSRTLVWDANYQGVWHLGNGVTLNATDSTSNANNGVSSNASAAAGEIGGGASFNGGNASVDLGGGSGLRITGPITAEAWINVTVWPANGYPAGLLGMGYSYASGWTGWMLEAVTDNGGNHYLSWASNNGAPHGVTIPGTLATGAWHHLAGVFDGSAWRMYLDGAANGSSADGTAPVNTGDDVVAGGLSTNGFGTIFLFNGLLDELRVSNTARSSDWIATEYHNQSSPGHFVSVGSAQSSGK